MYMSKLIAIFSLALLFTVKVDAQTAQELPSKRLSRNIANEIVYSSTWSANFKLRSDGWQLGGEITKAKNYFRSTIYQFELGEYKHPKQTRQSKDPLGGIFSNNGIRPFSFGKQNSLFSLHGAMGQKFLLAERARRNGVMINYYYAGGVTLGILKPSYVKVCKNIQCSEIELVTYEEGVNNRFLDYDYIIGGAGFGTGWKLGFRPGLHAKTGLQFDWSSQEDVIKSIEVGISSDIFFGKVPIMVSDENKFLFINGYIGIAFGKKR